MESLRFRAFCQIICENGLIFVRFHIVKYYEDEEILLEKVDSFENSEFVGCSFKGLDLQGHTFKNSKFLECRFEACNLSNVEILNSVFRDVEFFNSKLVGLNYSSTNAISQLSYKKSCLNFSIFQELNLENIIIEDCIAREIDFSYSNLKKSSFKSSDLLNCIFNNVDLTSADFSGAFSYEIDPTITKIKNAKFSLPEALSLLNSLGAIIK